MVHRDIYKSEEGTKGRAGWMWIGTCYVEVVKLWDGSVKLALVNTLVSEVDVKHFKCVRHHIRYGVVWNDDVITWWETTTNTCGDVTGWWAWLPLWIETEYLVVSLSMCSPCEITKFSFTFRQIIWKQTVYKHILTNLLSFMSCVSDFYIIATENVKSI